MKIVCPAKINLTLEVLNRREDGYHALRSVMVPLALCDELEIEPAPAFSFRCDDRSLDTADNLAARAALALEAAPPVAISLRKRIPAQAGLGGGSSDAAAVLLAAMERGFGRSYDVDWVALARSLGSDVPFFLARTGALVEGTGERVTAAGALPPWHVLVIKPPASVSTAAAFAQLDRATRPVRPRSESISLRSLTALQRGDFDAVEAALSNDFHEVIADATPEVARALDALHEAGAKRALLSGSGSAVFTLAREAAQIDRIVERLTLDASYLRFSTRFAAAPAWR
jgi:4-diphosphocytidyl-2-C-methyl-D-erythritol kinase